MKECKGKVEGKRMKNKKIKEKKETCEIHSFSKELNMNLCEYRKQRRMIQVRKIKGTIYLGIEEKIIK